MSSRYWNTPTALPTNCSLSARMVSAYLAQMALSLDYEITICDPRQDLLDQFSVAGVRKVADMPDDAVREYANDPATAIVALTHDPRIDDMGLMEALETDAFYIGAMGSTRSSASRRERLLAHSILRTLTGYMPPLAYPSAAKLLRKLPSRFWLKLPRYERSSSSPRACRRHCLAIDQDCPTNRRCTVRSGFWPSPRQ